MMTRFVVTLLVGLMVSLGALASLGSSAALAGVFICERYTFSGDESSFGLSLVARVESNGAPWVLGKGDESDYVRENRNRYSFYGEGKRKIHSTNSSGFARYNCKRKQALLPAGQTGINTFF